MGGGWSRELGCLSRGGPAPTSVLRLDNLEQVSGLHRKWEGDWIRGALSPFPAKPSHSVSLPAGLGIFGFAGMSFDWLDLWREGPEL